MTILAELRAGVTTASAEQTRRLAARLAAALPADTTLALHGDLGVGKTTFVQGLARGFGLSAQITSPTFNILHLYRDGPGLRSSGEGPAHLRHPRDRRSTLRARGMRRTMLVHLDAYRLENAHQIAELMLDDFLVSPYCIAVEWPERVAAWLPAETLHLVLTIESPERRRVTLAQPGNLTDPRLR